MSKPEDVSDGGAVVRAQYEWELTPPSSAVVQTVASVSDRGPTTFGPLSDAVDPDALNTLLEVAPKDPETSVSFTFADYVVTMWSGGGIVVRPDANVG